jgi:hypothetical protein
VDATTVVRESTSYETMHLRRKLAVLLFVAVMLATVAPAANADTAPWFPAWFGGLGVPAAGNVGMSGCGSTHGAEGQGGTGGSEANGCTGAGLVFIGPSSTVNTVIGPTIISPGFAGVVIVSNGPTAFGP